MASWRKVGQRQEAREHAGASEGAPFQVAAEIVGADRVDQVALPAEPEKERDEGEARPEKTSSPVG